jgi:hypothetical protein
MKTLQESTAAPHGSEWRRHWVVTLSAVAMTFALATFSSAVLRGKSSQAAAVPPEQPMTLVEVVKTLPPNSWRVVPFTLPYSGTLEVQVGVVDGNPMNVFVTTPDDMEAMRDDEISSVRASAGFAPTRSTSVRRAGRLSAGNYLLVLKDPAIGDASSRPSHVSIRAELRP